MHVIELVDRGASLSPDRTAFRDATGTTRLTYAATQDLTHRVAAALHRDGLGPGSAVAVLSPNTVHTFPYVLGVVRAGCAWVGINARSSIPELVGFLSHAAPRALVVHESLADVAGRLLAQVPSLERVVTMEDPEAIGSDWLAAPGTRVPLPPLAPEGIVALFSTGGTTGEAKVVRLSHRAFETMTLAMTTHLPERQPVQLVAAPLTHAAGALVFPVLLTGGTNVVHSRVDAGEILHSIQENRITRLFLPPTAVYALLEHPGIGDVDVSSLTYFIYGAAPMSVAKLREAMRVFGPVMTQFYGQVELPMMCTFFGPDEHREAVEDPALGGRLLSCGRASVVADIAVMDDDDNLLPTGEEGEVVVRSSLQMSGYLGDDEQTAKVRRPGDWQATGDIGVLDADGYLYLRDRKRDLIVTGGFNVFPLEVEQVLWDHPAVLDCAVIGVPDEKWGERVTAVVELKPGALATEDELLTWSRARLSGIKAPKSVVLSSLPRSSVGKVLKRELRERYWSGHDRRV